MDVSLVSMGDQLRNQSSSSFGSLIDNFNAYYEQEFGYLFNLVSDEDGTQMPISQSHYELIQQQVLEAKFENGSISNSWTCSAPI